MRHAFLLISWGLVAGCSRPSPQGNEVHPSAQPDAVTSAAPLVAPPLPRDDGIYYTFAVAKDLSMIRADVCFVGRRPARLLAPTPEAVPLLRAATGPSGRLETPHGAIDLDGVSGAECVHYAVDTASALARDTPRDGAGRVGDDALLSPDWWLWAPEGAEDGQPLPPLFARFTTLEGPQPTLPWPRRAGSEFDFTVPPSAFVWKAQGAFAQHAPKPLVVGKSTLDVTVLGAGFGAREPLVHTWLTRSANAVAGLLGNFPVERGQVLLVAEAERRGSFGYVLHGGGPSATMLLPARPTDTALNEDWTAVHELLHFSHPPMRGSEAWFYEGLATYLTALARARSGMTTREYGWWELLDGFERGSKVGTGQTLREECKTMHENHSYWRVYWSGAAMLLEMDVALRAQGKTLEGGIATLAQSSLDTTHRWTAEELVKQLDTYCGCDDPSRITAVHLDQTAFPDMTDLAQRLGVKLAGKGRVTYNDAALDREIRRAIMGGD